jgi:two-component system, NarL family, response regulator NreC
MLIDAQPDMLVVGEAQDGKEALRMADEANPDVFLLDITMPNAGGLQIIPELLKRHSAAHVLLLTMHDEAAYLRTALAAGASGYVLKKSVDADLLSAIRAVHKGRRYIDSELAESLILDAIPERSREPGSLPEARILSDREVQVLKLVAEGFSSREIADQLLVSTKTIETYRSRFGEKLGLNSRADIVRYALTTGLLSSETVSSDKSRE